jgi:murein DD-endopeptidase MepM/ murein hydrolase activator NlpD
MKFDWICWNIPRWRVVYHLMGVFTLLWLSACMDGGEVSAGEAAAEAMVEVGTTPTVTLAQEKLATAEPSPTATSQSQSEAVPSPLPPTEPPVAPQEPAICSPLAVHPFSELPEIVSAEYDPPPPGKEARHQGVDFSYYRRGERSSILGVGVTAVFRGAVAAAIEESFPYGNMVIVETYRESLPEKLITSLGMAGGESLYLLYAHLDGAPEVALGESVEACQRLGVVGKSGNAGVPHLHLEARLGEAGVKFEGMAYYSTQTMEQERENYELWRTSGAFKHLNPMDLFIQSD